MMIDRYGASLDSAGNAGYSIVTEDGVTLAWFDTLYECALVKRYISGVIMPREDMEQAKDIIRRFDSKKLMDYSKRAV